MISNERWADQWIGYWNKGDVDGLMSLYADDVQLRAPFAKLYGDGGLIKGKQGVRKYFDEYIRRMPNITMHKIAVYNGHLALALHCEDSKGRKGVKTILFNDQDKAIFETTCLDRVR